MTVYIKQNAFMMVNKNEPDAKPWIRTWRVDAMNVDRSGKCIACIFVLETHLNAAYFRS